MPAITSITPATFDAGRSVTLSGSGFGTTQGSVLIGGVSQNVTNWAADGTSITFTTVRGSQSLGACRVDVVGGNSTGATAFFTDGFESANLSSVGGGFSWDTPNRTSVVTGVAGQNAQLFPSYVFVGDSRDWSAKVGSNALRFRYVANEPMTEQRFFLTGGQTDLYFQYWLRVPVNFTHNAGVGGNASNNKFFVLWQDGYEAAGDGASVFWNLWDNGASGSDLAFSYSVGGFAGSGGIQQITSFIATPSDRGRWMKIIVRCRVATTRSSNDGVMQLWRRWDGDANFTQIHTATNLNLMPPTTGASGWRNGYLMGYANAPYTTDTEFLLDDFQIFSEAPI